MKGEEPGEERQEGWQKRTRGQRYTEETEWSLLVAREAGNGRLAKWGEERNGNGKEAELRV